MSWRIAGPATWLPMLPMSKDVARLADTLEILSLYRLAFGQPRQEELLENLLRRKFTLDEIEQIKKALVINLSPLMDPMGGLNQG